MKRMQSLPHWVWLLGFALFFLIVGAVRIAPPDLAYYYAFAHSMVHDTDFFFGNQFEMFEFAMHELYLTEQGFPANDWPIGTGLLWMPFLLLAMLMNGMIGLLGFADAGWNHHWLDLWVVTYGATIIYAAGTVLLAYQLGLAEQLKHNTLVWGVALITLGSSFTYHLYVNSADSHAPSAFFITLFLLIWLKLRNEDHHSNQLYLFIQILFLGCALGIAALVRPHNVIFLLTPVLDILISPELRKHCLKWFGIVGISTLIAGLVYLPQMMLWRELYGSWLAVPRSEEVLWLQPHLWEMLFSDFHGMISWSPLFGLGLLGLMLNKRWVIYAVPVLIQIYIYSCNLAWWSGGSFGNRRMVGCMAVFVLGVATLLQRYPKWWLKIVCIVAAGWTYSLLLAEMGGVVQLDHYQPWDTIVPHLPEGAWLGLQSHLSRGAWQEHTAERLMGAIVVLFVICSVWHCGKLLWLSRPKVALSAVMALILAWLGIGGVAITRSEQALANAGKIEIPHYDRFLWVVYFEEGFYHLQNQDFNRAMESYLAATLAEPRHPQPYMYLSMISRQNGWAALSYPYAIEAMVRGQRSTHFLNYFESVLTEKLFTTAGHSAITYNRRGVVQAIRGFPNQAKNDFEMALTIDPDYIPAQENLAIMQEWSMDNQPPLSWE